MPKTINSKLKSCLSEKDVENGWRAILESFFPNSISSPHKTDGVLSHPDVSGLLEFKYETQLTSPLCRSEILIQTLFYLKKMEAAGDPLPKTIFVGDSDECFCLETPVVAKYLSRDLDWSVAPSEAAKANPKLVMEFVNDNEICPFIFDIHKDFDILMVIQKMANISQGKPVAVQITKKNIVSIFQRFKDVVILDSKAKQGVLFGTDESHKELVDIFFKCLVRSEDVYLHPSKTNTLVTPNGPIKVNKNGFLAFFSQFRQNYTPKEMEELTANKDRILEDAHRRETGAFFTPDIWVDKAHSMIAEVFGEDWKEKYIVWDCACGTANLTRGYKFKELYLSTLDQTDIDIIRDCHYNPEAVLFQYDFLGEVGFDGVPEGLRNAIKEGKEIICLMNPPYGTSANLDIKEGNNKAGIAKNPVNDKMLSQKMGLSSRQLYIQFIYKLAQNNIHIATFAPPLFMSGPSCKKFQKEILTQYNYQNGMLFQASHFSDVANQWGISFTIWKKESSKTSIYTLKIADINSDSFLIEEKGIRRFYSPENPANEWIKPEKNNPILFPHLSNAINISDKDHMKMELNAFGTYSALCNNVEKNTIGVSIFSGIGTQGNGSCCQSILPENIHKVVALFCARKSITPNWINCKDEYSAPNTSHPDYSQWNSDCFVYSLFNNSSQQSSLRQVEYKGKKWDIPNHFFFVSIAEMQELANTNCFTEMYQDAKTNHNERYMYLHLNIISLSEDAKEVLEMARELVRKSMAMRKLYHEEHPEYHLASFDAGWAQLKPMLKQYFKQDYDAFVEKYKTFEDRMRDGVYAFGFLEK